MVGQHATAKCLTKSESKTFRLFYLPSDVCVSRTCPLMRSISCRKRTSLTKPQRKTFAHLPSKKTQELPDILLS